MNNLALMTDSYKASHFLQFPDYATRSFYYLSARDKTAMVRFYGLQYIIKKFFMDVPSVEQIDQAKKIWETSGLPFNEEGWKKIAEIGYLPLEIRAIPEGMVVPGGIPMVTVSNTIEGFEWLPGWIETLLMQVWYPTTVCTNSYMMKLEIMKWLEISGTPGDIDFKLHDFGYRGVSSNESAGIGGSAHLVNFMGADTMAGVLTAMEYYNTDIPGFSIPASEHSTMTSWGREGEEDAYQNMIDKFAKDGALVAVVSDSYDLYNAVENIWGGTLRDQVIESGATIVIRPDSGEPSDVVLKTLKILDEKFGSTVNEKGYIVLNPSVRIIQGDGLSNVGDIWKVLKTITDNGYSADNLTFGMGGGLLQQCNRDTYKFAMKCSAVFNGSEWLDVYKQPVDAPWKASMKGVLGVSPDFEIFDFTSPNTHINILRPVFLNGNLIVDETFDDIKKRA